MNFGDFSAACGIITEDTAAAPLGDPEAALPVDGHAVRHAFIGRGPDNGLPVAQSRACRIVIEAPDLPDGCINIVDEFYQVTGTPMDPEPPESP